MEASLRAVLERRLTLISILIVVGVVTGAAIIALGAEKAIPGTSNDHYISVVKQQPGQSAGQRMRQHAEFQELETNLTAIAIKNQSVSALLAGKNYSVVGIAIHRVLPAPPDGHHVDEAALFVRVDHKFYRIDIDIPHETVTSVAERACYGPACNN